MRLIIHAKPRSRQNAVFVDPDDVSNLTVHTTQPADKGRANDAVIKLLASHFGVPQSCLTLVSGLTSRTKLVDLDE